MEWINKSISNYQEIIGAYEKQVWERSLEKAILETFSHVTWKRAKVNLDLIDVDLVRGSTFSKTKQRQGWILIVKRTLIRAVLLPFCYQWWKSSTSWFIFWLLSLLYALQVASFITYFTDADDAFGTESLSLAHLFSPCVLLLVVALVQTQVIETSRPRDSASPRCKTPIANGARSKRKVQQQNGVHMVSENGSVGSHDTGIDSNPDDVCADHASADDRNSSYYPETKVSSNNTTAPSDVDNDSPTVYDDDTGRHVTDTDDESDDGSIMVAKDTLNSVSHTKRASFEKTSAWVQQLKMLRDTSSAEVGSLASKDTKEVEWSRNPLLHQVSCGLFQRKSSAVSLNGYRLVNEDNGMRQSLSENDTEIGVDDDDDNRLRHRNTSVFASYKNKQDQKMKKTDHKKYSGKKLAINYEEKDFCQLKLLPDCVSNQDKGLVIPERESKSVCDVISFDSEVNRHCRGSCVGSENANARPFESQVESILLPTEKKDQMRGTPAYQTVNGKQQKLKNRSSGELDDDATGGNYGVTSMGGDSVSEFSDNEMTASDNDWAEDKSAILHSLASENSKVGCFIWDSDEVERVDMTGLEISSRIIKRVESSPESCDDILLGLCISGMLTLIPIAYRVYHSRDRLATLDPLSLPDAFAVFEVMVGHNWRQMVIIMNGILQRFCFGLFVVLLLSVAERHFKQRLLVAKNFCYLTSLRRSRKYNLPHFRLSKVRNIKTWLSVRSFLKRRGPQRSVETIVSDAFIASVVIVSVISVQLLQDGASFLDALGNWELVLWVLVLGIYLLKFITLGSKINRKYHNSSVLITEQINLYLQMEQKPNKKDELMMANSVLRLAEDLLKDLEGPFNISGLSANPLLYNITKVVVLSAFSAVLTELLGFKLKLYKINLRT